jgi:hypothetical protein
MALTPEQNNYLLELYDLSDGNVNQALKLFNDKYGFPPANSTVRKKWSEAGLLPLEKGKRYSNTDFTEVFRKCEGNLEKIAKETGLRENTILSRAIVLNLIPPRQLRRKCSQSPTPGKYDKFLNPNI